MLRLNHVALTVTDRTRAAEFYRNYFAFGAAVHEDDHLLILADANGGLLALSSGQVPKLPRTNHFGLQASSPDEVLALRARFAADGLVETEFQEHGPTRVQVLDPDSNRVEVYAF